MNRNINVLRVLALLSFCVVCTAESRVRKLQQPKLLSDEESGNMQQEFDESTGQPPVVRSVDESEKGYEFSVEAKRKQVLDLVDKSVDYFNKTESIEKIFNAFSSSQEFLQGELYVFIYDMKGTCWASGLNQERIWHNFYDEKDAFGTPIVRAIIETAKNGGGWLTYEWYYSIKVTYAKKVTKDGKDYAIGCGYYPCSKEDAVIGLVKAAVSRFNKTVSEGKSKAEALGLFGYPLGRFVAGDLYIYAMTFSGDVVAHGERGGLIGSNGWDYRDARGKFVNREIVEKLKSATGGVWVEYFSKRAPKRTYAEKVIDNQGVEYFIACGYYPDANKNAAIDLVRKGYVFMKGHGLTEATTDFNDIDCNDYRYGDLYLVAYDLEGKCIADGSNLENVGRSMWDDKDADGRHFVRELIQKAKDGGGWVDFKAKNSFKSNYVELIDLGTGKYAICCGLYPTTKLETMSLLAKSAADYLRAGKSLKDVIGDFTKPHGTFVRGDLSVFVLTLDGICLAYGSRYDLIWKNLSSWKDSSGIPVVKLLSDSLQRGPGLVAYMQDGLKNVAYIEEVHKNGGTYIVGSKFFQ